ncbi:MAG: hypothetical protein IT180_03305 [Acidobacteria bacterium]|nr:hypothetical protein [Acidobacteriota bacterium]
MLSVEVVDHRSVAPEISFATLSFDAFEQGMSRPLLTLGGGSIEILRDMLH